MAYISLKFCPKCLKGTEHRDHVCSECTAREEAEMRAKWDKMTTDERFEAIDKRLKELEKRRL